MGENKRGDCGHTDMRFRNNGKIPHREYIINSDLSFAVVSSRYGLYFSLWNRVNK